MSESRQSVVEKDLAKAMLHSEVHKAARFGSLFVNKDGKYAVAEAAIKAHVVTLSGANDKLQTLISELKKAGAKEGEITTSQVQVTRNAFNGQFQMSYLDEEPQRKKSSRERAKNAL